MTFHPLDTQEASASFLSFEDVTWVSGFIRKNKVLPAPSLSWLEIALWPDLGRATIFGNPIELTGIEFRILEALVDAQGLTVSRRALWEFVYGTRWDADSRAIDMQVSRLRRRLRASNLRLHSSRESGYRLESKSPTLASIVAGNRVKQMAMGPSLRDCPWSETL